jgi:ferric-dicitrate binding protein FerR (iron transport regulator)
MRCDDVQGALNARADGELGEADARALDAHLAGCAQCRSAAEGLQAIDAELRRAFVPGRKAAALLAERVAAEVRARVGTVTAVAPPAAPAPRLAWGQVLVAVAAGFLLAIAVFRPWQPRSARPALPPRLEPVGRMAVASGPVEVRPASQVRSFLCPPDTPIGRDSIVRTGPTAQCEISLADGNALRLDCNTEVTLHESEVVEVSRGRLWSTSQPGRKGPEIQSGGGTFLASAAAQLAIDCQPQAVRLVVVDGQVTVQTAQRSMEVGPGRQVRIVQGRLEDGAYQCDALLETAWVNRVLALRSSENPELVERVNQLLASVGAAKLSLLYEDELRRLGDDGVPPLLAYLTSTRAMASGAQRATAARIVADVAQSRWIADLIALLTDANPDVRFHAARGLERLTGRDQGCEARAWQSQPWSACAGAHQQWLEWWAENRDRYPAARRDIPAPASPPF